MSITDEAEKKTLTSTIVLRLLSFLDTDGPPSLLVDNRQTLAMDLLDALASDGVDLAQSLTSLNPSLLFSQILSLLRRPFDRRYLTFCIFLLSLLFKQPSTRLAMDPVAVLAHFQSIISRGVVDSPVREICDYISEMIQLSAVEEEESAHYRNVLRDTGIISKLTSLSRSEALVKGIIGIAEQCLSFQHLAGVCREDPMDLFLESNGFIFLLISSSEFPDHRDKICETIGDISSCRPEVLRF